MAGVTDMADRPVRAIYAPRLELRRMGVLALAAIGCTVGSAAENRTTFTVGARVLAQVSLSVASEPAGVAVSADDVRQGYVEIREPTRVTVSSNSPSGYTLLVLPQSRWFSAVTVRGAGGDVTMGAEGGTIVERGHGARMALELTYRFSLDSQLPPGRYPWPLHLAVRPLDSP